MSKSDNKDQNDPGVEDNWYDKSPFGDNPETQNDPETIQTQNQTQPHAEKIRRLDQPTDLSKTFSYIPGKGENTSKSTKVDTTYYTLEVIKKLKSFLRQKIYKPFSKSKPKVNSHNQNTSITPKPENGLKEFNELSKVTNFLAENIKPVTHTKPPDDQKSSKLPNKWIIRHPKKKNLANKPSRQK